MPSAPQLLKIIQDNAQNTGNKCGLTVMQLSERSGVPFAEIKDHLNQLYREGEIQAREGIHGKLIFKQD